MVIFENPKTLLLIPLAIAILFIIIRKDFVKLKGARWNFLEKAKVRRRLFVFSLRSIALAGLIAALANPMLLSQELSKGDPALTILVDESRSFDLFDRAAAEKIKTDLEGTIPVKLRSIASQNSSAIGDELLAAMLGNDNLLLVSDGRVTNGRSLGDVMILAASINSTINSLYLEPIKSDISVRVEGPRVTTVGIDNEFLVRIDQTAPPGTPPIGYDISVKLDGEEVIDESGEGPAGFRFTRKLEEGYHRIAAELSTSHVDDHFSENNAFLKTVKVEKKPKVLLVSGENTPLEQLFSPIYDLTSVPSMGGTALEGYSATVLNDIPASAVDTEKLAGFIDEGNGVVVFGGRSSYDKGEYKGKPIENLLPVTVGSGEEGEKKFVNVVLLIDISGSTGAGFGTGSASTVEEVEKALATGIVNDLRPEDKVGVIAFNVEPHTVTELERLSANKNQLIGNVQRLRWTGSTLIGEGIAGARQMLRDVEGSKNIVLLSDGKSGSMGDDLVAARYAAEQGIKIYAVGVGEGTNSEHMQAIAEKGNGIYLEPTEAQKLKIIFGRSEAAPTDKLKLEKLNNNHFITRNVKLSAKLLGFNQAVPKPNADVLVATAENRPILTVWRFGLGRIAAITTDDGTGWAAELVNKQNSVLLTRAVNWAIGDLSRNKNFDVTARDAHLGQSFEIEVISDSMPHQNKLEFSKIGERSYFAEFKPEITGWYSFLDATAAANYQIELLNTGIDPELNTLIQTTGGQAFRPDQINELLEKVKEDSKRLVTTQKSLAWIPIAIALMAFLLEIAIRKAFEARERLGTGKA